MCLSKTRPHPFYRLETKLEFSENINDTSKTLREWRNKRKKVRCRKTNGVSVRNPKRREHVNKNSPGIIINFFFFSTHFVMVLHELYNDPYVVRVILDRNNPHDVRSVFGVGVLAVLVRQHQTGVGFVNLKCNIINVSHRTTGGSLCARDDPLTFFSFLFFFVYLFRTVSISFQRVKPRT